MDLFKQKSRGVAMWIVGIIIAATLLGIISVGVIKTASTSYVSESAAKADAKARYVAESKMELIKANAYENLQEEGRKVFTTSGLETEVTIGPEEDIGNGNKKKDIVVKVFNPGGTAPLTEYTYMKTLAGQGGGNFVINKGRLKSGNYIPLPAGFTEDQCVWGVMPVPGKKYEFIGVFASRYIYAYDSIAESEWGGTQVGHQYVDYWIMGAK